MELEAQLARAEEERDRLKEENRRLLCKINPHLESVFFPDQKPTITAGEIVQSKCSLAMSDKQVRFCATHKLDLDAKGRCPVSETTLFRKQSSPMSGQGRRIMGSQFCRAKDDKFEPAAAGEGA